MNIKLKVTGRTPYSEEAVVLATDMRDENDEPVNIGKLDIHYMDDQIVGTLLIWQEFAEGFNRTHAPGSDLTMDGLIDLILGEVSEPLGVPGEYGVEVYYPPARNHVFASNFGDDGADETEEGLLSEYGTPADEEPDDFTKQHRERPGR